MQKKPVVLRAKNLVEKRNLLNEMKSVHMTLQEVRFLSIYLSRINARDISTRVVRFSIGEFMEILDIKKINIWSLMETTDKLLGKVVNIPDDKGGYVGFQLFKECKVYKEEEGNNWFVEIDAHDRALPLMFDFKKEYFNYTVDNVMRLLSPNQIRMYEILKQYEYLGERTISIEKLKEKLGIAEDEHIRFNNFKIKVLDSCQTALNEHTDIRYEYKLIKKGRGGKVSEICFIISKNNKVFPSLMRENESTNAEDTTADAFGSYESEMTKNEQAEGMLDYGFLADAFDNEFTLEEVKYLYALANPILRREVSRRDFLLRAYDYFKLKYDLLNTKKGVGNRYGYIKKLMELDR